MRKQLYQKRVDRRVCVNCCSPLGECTKRKCVACLRKDSTYKRDTRTAKRATQERDYRTHITIQRLLRQLENTPVYQEIARLLETV